MRKIVALLLTVSIVPFGLSPALAFGKTPAELSAALTDLVAQPDRNHIVVQFDQPMNKTTRQALDDRGLILQGYVGNNSFLAAVARDRLNVAAIPQVSTLSDALPIEREMKLQPMLARLEIPDFAIVSPGKEDVDDANPVIAVYVRFHRDVPLRPDAADIVQRHGGWVRSFVHAADFLVVEMPLLEVGPLADEDAVQTVSLPLPKFSELNNSNREITQANTVQDPPYDLDGTGVHVLVYDGGYAWSGHPDFGGRLTIRDASGQSDHATHVSGTIGGDGTDSTGLYRGMAPGVIIESYGFEQDGGLQEGFLYTDPGDIHDDYSEAITTYGVHISNNSIGTNTAPNGFPCDWEGNYGDTGILIDTIVRGGIDPDFPDPFRIVWANGNERQTTRCFTSGLDEYHTTAPPACAKNHITVGALNSNDDSVTDFTSWGPTDDGRIKPDLSGPGCQSDDDFDVTSCSSYGGYTGKCGTSMSSPTVCGLSSLLIQDYRAQFPDLYADSGDPRNSTLKALLAHNAVDIENTGPDYKTGYGSVRIQNTIDFMRTGNWVQGEITDTGDTVSMLVFVQTGDPEFKATLAWDDMPGTLVYGTGAPVLVNDLDLRVWDPSGIRHYPWTLNPAVPWDPAVQTAEDHANNIEQVYVANPDPGVWLVEVHGYNVPDTTIGTQPFSLAAGPLLIKCSSQGVVKLNSSSYACDDTAEIKVVDCDLNTDDLVIETVTVTIASTSEPTAESVLLTETGEATADFRGTIPLSTTDAAGVLLVAHADTVTATYVDADDGQGGTNIPVTAQSTIDCVAPIISNVQVTNIGPFEATVEFTTDEDAGATVRYGASCSSLDLEATSSFKTTHSVRLSSLWENTAYYFVIDAEDRAGNATTADNGGACFSFVTTDIPVYFTQQFGSGFDLDGHTLTFVPNGSIDFYFGCIEPITALPTDPTGGTTIPPGSWDTSSSDDSYKYVTITGGQTVSLYGTAYSDFYIGTNGYVTFTSSDTDYSETIGDHFDLPRISAYFDDLNPGSGGTVSYKELADRVAVTWEDVPEYSSTGANTFQIEMFFDGTITISFLGMTGADCITGLSAGGGEPPAFFEVDLSAIGPCAPTPPTAFPATLSTPYTMPTTIVLVASDDGRPDPPAALSYIITSLPAQKLRDAGNGTIITPAALPYTLVGSGRQVTYEPGPGFVGTDSFEFKANDGGVPPEGGDSNTALVTIDVVLVPWLHHSFPMDSDPRWGVQGQWAFGQPTGGGSHDGDPDKGYTGSNVYGYNLNGDYGNNIPQYFLTTPAINCTDITDVELRFWRWLGVEAAIFDHAHVEVSNDATNWTMLWEHTGADPISDTNWSQMTFDISAVADNQPTVYVRWCMGATDGGNTYPGWNIDDVEIWGIGSLCGDMPGDFDDDCDVDLNDFATFATCFHGSTITVPPPGCTPDQFADCDLDDDGDVDLADFSTFSFTFTG
ncbi:MAG: S8 family serine peptidase [Phycisphaerales bacterium]|nr:MAG: S8 family serine peptidase [Phycisphaerales bacterium]